MALVNQPITRGSPLGFGCPHGCPTNAIAYGKHTRGHGQYHNRHL